MISLPNRKALPALVALLALILIVTACKDFFVDPKLTSIAVTPATPSILVNATIPMVAVGTYDDNTTKALTSSATWSVSTSSPAGAATVSDATATKGVVTGILVGSATVQATVGTVSGSTTVTVASATLQSIVITATTTTISRSAGTTSQFTAIGHYADGTTLDITDSVTWTSADTTIATLGTTGVAAAASGSTATGPVNITAVSGSVTSNIIVLTVDS